MLTERRGVLRELADAVANGETVDWTAASRRVRSTPAEQVALNLKALSALSGVRGPSRSNADPLPARFPPWFQGLQVLALLQVAGGLLALLWVPRDAGPIPPALLAVNAAAFAAGALVLLRLGRADPRAADLAGFFLAVAAACSHRPLRWLIEAGHGAWPLVWLRGMLPDAFLPVFLWRFARAFPRLMRLSPTDSWVRGATRVSGTLGVCLFAANVVAYINRPADPPSHPWLGPLTRNASGGLYWTLLFGLSLSAVAMIAWRSREALADERRRARLFAAGLAIGLAPLLFMILAEFLVPPAKGFIEGRGLYLVGYVIYLPLLTVPFTVGYAVVASQVPALSLIIRQGLHRLLARSALVGLVILSLSILGFYVYLHRDQSAAAVLGGPVGRGLALTAALGGCALFLRDWFARRIDDSMVEARPSHASALASLATATRSTDALPVMSAAVSTLLARALRAHWAAVFTREEARTAFAPFEPGRRPLDFESALAKVLEQGQAPLVTDPRESRSSFRWFPMLDREWLTDNEVAALVPLGGREGKLLGFIAVGPKQDDLPWTREDRLFLTAVGGPVSLGLEARGLGQSSGAAARAADELAAAECSRCGRVTAVAAPGCDCGGTARPCPLPWVLSGKFRVERVLGRGGMGVVYGAVDLDLQRPVALKTLPGVAPAAALRLRQEARSMASLMHPNLALIFGAEGWRGVPVLVVEYLAGGTLARRLPGPLPVGEMMALGMVLTQALEAMHVKGLLHRDVKPSNIGFTEDNVPKLLDFGLARLMAEARASPSNGPPPTPDDRAELSLTASGHVAGTPLYLSPEALAGQPPGPEQDLWALSLVLYEGLAGRHPWRNAPHHSWLSGLAIPDVRSLNPGLPSPVGHFFQDALNPRPERRPRSAADLRRGLEELLAVL